MISNLLCRIISFLFLLFRLEDLIVFVSSWFHHFGFFILVVMLWSSSCLNELTGWPYMANACKCFDMFAIWSVSVVSCNSNVLKAQPCHCDGLCNIVPSFCVILLSSQNPPIDFQCVVGVWHYFHSHSEGSTRPHQFSPPVTSCSTASPPSQRLLGMFEHWA